MNYLLIQIVPGIVTSVWPWNIDTQGPLPDQGEGLVFVEDTSDGEVQPGWNAIQNEDQTWSFSPQVIPPLTPEQILEVNHPLMLNRLSLAVSSAMGHVLMTMDFTGKTDAESIAAKAWQDYYRAVQATDITVLSPAWPDQPSA